MQGTQGGMQIFFLVAMFVLFYFMLIRPQRQQQKKRLEMLKALKVGDKIVTTGGIFGSITKINEKSLRVKIAPNVEVRVERGGVGRVTVSDTEE